jgi:hypothetical protein
MNNKTEPTKFILDACCGNRSMWFDKNHPNALYIDKREFEQLERQGHQSKIVVKPDMVMDFRKMSFQDRSFKLVVCDPPHLTKLGDSGIYCKLYGKLSPDWKTDLKDGFQEMWRVLDDYGILLIKWNDYEISFKELRKLFPTNPLFANIKNGAGGSKTKWFCFMKIPIAETETQGATPSFNKDLTATQQVASPKCPSDTSLNPDI